MESLEEGRGPGTALGAAGTAGLRGPARPLPLAGLGPQDGSAETHQHHPTGPQSLSWRWLKVIRPFEKTRLGSKASNT